MEHQKNNQREIDGHWKERIIMLTVTFKYTMLFFFVNSSEISSASKSWRLLFTYDFEYLSSLKWAKYFEVNVKVSQFLNSRRISFSETYKMRLRPRPQNMTSMTLVGKMVWVPKKVYSKIPHPRTWTRRMTGGRDSGFRLPENISLK